MASNCAQVSSCEMLQNIQIPTVLNYLRELQIELYYKPTHKSEVNGQIERFHSTFLEIPLLKVRIPHL